MNKPKNQATAAPSARHCYASVLEAAREIDGEIGGRELARMPPECARLIVRLKRWIQDGDAAGIRDLERPPLDFAQKLTIAVGECIADQRNGMDVLASASWDRVCEVWAEEKNRRDA